MFAPVGFTDTVSNALTSLVLDGSGDKVAFVGYCHKAGTIDRIDCPITAVAGTPPTYQAQLESVANNAPSGSAIAVDTNGIFTPVASGLQSTTLVASHAVAAGDVIAAVIQYSSGVVDASNKASVGYRTTGTMASNGPVGFSDTGAGWVSSRFAAGLSPRYSGGEYITGVQMITGSTSIFFNVTDTPDERAILWIPPGDVTVAGVVAGMRTFGTAGAVSEILLYDSANVVLGTITIDATKIPDVTFFIGYFFFAEGPQQLTGGETYRFSYKPDANDIYVIDYQYANNDALIASNGGLFKSTRTDGGAWSDDNTIANKLWPIISTIPAGGGGGNTLSRSRLAIGM